MRSVAEILRWRTRRDPNRLAISFDDRHQSFQELNRRTTKLANALIRLGVNPGDRVGVLDKAHDRLIETIFAIAKAGAVYTPVNWRLAPTEIRAVLSDSGVSVLFIGEEYFEAFRTISEDLPTLRALIAYDQNHADWHSYESLLANADENDPKRDGSGSDTSWQIYTSGTTGAPKGVEITHENLISMCTSGGLSYGNDPVALSCLPLFHIGGAGSMLSSLFQGARIVVTRQVDALEIVKLLERERITHALFVPALLNILLRVPGIKSRDFSSLRTIIYGASPIPEDLLAQAIETFKCGFVQAYGLSETTGSVTMLMERDHAPSRGKLRSCGLPVFGHEIRIVDEAGKTCAAGGVGEVMVRGPNVMKGYWKRTSESAAALRGGWLHTGDAGFLDEDGYLYIQDRVKDMIISGGENIYPAEVENALFAHPEIVDAAVIGIPDKRWGESVLAVVVCAPDSHIADKDVIAFCATHIASYKRPRFVEFVDALPRNSSGKVLKTKLREQYWIGRDRNVN